MEMLMGVLYGKAPPICFERDVEPMLQNSLKRFEHTTYYYCNNCSSMLSGAKGVCRNVECPLYEVDVKRAKASKRVEVHVVNMLPQLEDVCSNYLDDIIAAHDRVHRGLLTARRNDVRLFPGFSESIESREEFQSNHIRLPLSISTDGFKPKRISRLTADMWPLYLRVDDINGNESNRFENSILCGAIYGRTRPNDLLIDNLLTRLEDRPIVIASAGKVWHISAKIYRGVADMAAQQALFGIPRWNSDYGCSKCLLRGIRVDGSQVWFNQDGTQAQMRSPESYLSDGDLQINGIQRVTAAMRVMPPSIFSSDALHVCSEGITKDRLQDIFTAGSKFPGLRVNTGAVQRMKKCLLATSTHTYANAIILAIEDLPNCSGSEIDEVAFVAFPVLAAVSAIPSPVAAASLIGYWLSLRMIAKTTRLTTDVIEIAQRIAGITKALWISMAPGIFTMKCHWFFDHGMRAELDRYGTLYQWSSAPFESHHRRLQVKVNQATTNSSSLVIEKYLLLKNTRSLLARRCTDGRDEFRKLLDIVDNCHVNRFPMHTFVNDDMYIPTNSFVEEVINEHQCFLKLQYGDIPLSRLVIRGKVYASRTYWKRPRSSRQDVVELKGVSSDDDTSFGSILLFLYNRNSNSVKVVLEEFVVSDPFVDLGNQVNHVPHPCRRLALQLMRMVVEHNHFFKKIDAQSIRVRSAADILGPSCLLDYGTASYVSVV